MDPCRAPCRRGQAAGGSRGLRREEDVGPELAKGTCWDPAHPAQTVSAVAVRL